MTELRPDCGLPEHEQLDDARCCAREVRELADLYMSGLPLNERMAEK